MRVIPQFIKTRRAFSLVEVTVTVGILSFCMLAVFALLPVGLNIVQESSREGAAMNLLTTICSDLRSTPSGMTNSQMFEIPVISGGSQQTGSLYLDRFGNVAPRASADFQATWKQNASTTNGVPFNVLVRISWAAQAQEPSGFVETLFLPENKVQ